MTGFFLSVEGIEGVGKSTAVKFIEQYLLKKQKDFVLTREPGGTPIAEQIRRVLLEPNQTEKMMMDTEVLLMFASRAQHIHTVILPALQAGKHVISDRYVDASFAYQGGGRQIDFSHLNHLTQWIVKGVIPNMTILLDAPAEIGLARAKHRGPHDRIEQETVDFFDRVRHAYLLRAKEDPKRFRVIDATQSVEVVQDELQKCLEASPLR